MTSKVINFPNTGNAVDTVLEEGKAMNFDAVVVIGIVKGDGEDTVSLAGHVPEDMSRLHIKGAIYDALHMLGTQ